MLTRYLCSLLPLPCIQVLSVGGGGGDEPQEDDTTHGNNNKAKRAPRRISCSLRLASVCAGRGGEVVRDGALLPAVVRGVEDHGFTLQFGIKVG